MESIVYNCHSYSALGSDNEKMVEDVVLVECGGGCCVGSVWWKMFMKPRKGIICVDVAPKGHDFMADMI